MSPTWPTHWVFSGIPQLTLRKISVVSAISAGAADFDDRAGGREAGIGGGLPYPSGESVVVDVNGLPAGIANEENAVVEAIGMGVRDIGIRTLDPTGQIGGHEQVEDSIDAVRGNAAVLVLRNSLGDVIGAGRPVERGESFENGGPHVRPLFATAGQPLARRIAKRLALMKLMLVCGHGHGNRLRAERPQGADSNALFVRDPIELMTERQDSNADHRVERLRSVVRKAERARHDSEAEAADCARHHEAVLQDTAPKGK